MILDEAFVGLLQVFVDAGDEVEASPTLRRRDGPTPTRRNVLTLIQAWGNRAIERT